jgi:hypothetical protein
MTRRSTQVRKAPSLSKAGRIVRCLKPAVLYCRFSHFGVSQYQAGSVFKRVAAGSTFLYGVRISFESFSGVTSFPPIEWERKPRRFRVLVKRKALLRLTLSRWANSSSERGCFERATAWSIVNARSRLWIEAVLRLLAADIALNLFGRPRPQD